MKKENYEYKDYDLALQRQKERYYKRVKTMIKTNKERCFFLTFTFNDATLKNTNEKTRLRYIKKFLNEQANNYVLNIDYGEKNEREHYHAFIMAKYKMVVVNDYKIGYIKIKKLTNAKRFKNTIKKSSAVKLTEHAFKKTTQNTKIIYSRQLKINRDFKYKELADQMAQNYAKKQAQEEEYIKAQEEQKKRDSLMKDYFKTINKIKAHHS